MSTRTSADMHVTRSTTRVRVAPGGNTTISFGDEYSTFPPKPTKQPEQVITEKVAEIAIEETPVEVTATEKKIVLVVAGNHSEEIIQATTKALADENMKHVDVIKVKEYLALPYIVQNISKQENIEGIIAATVFTNEFANASPVSQSLMTTLYNIGLTANVFIIPGVVVADNLLEAKVSLKAHANSWVQSLSALLPTKAHAIASEAIVVPEATHHVVVTPDVADVETLLNALRESLKAHGARGIVSLGKKFRIIDDDNNGSINLSEFTKAINEHTLNWSPSQIKQVFDSFDADKSGSISFDEFLIGVRGELNERRTQLVLQAFAILDADHSGVVDIEDIKLKYDASKHPDVISGKKSSEEIFAEFLDTFDAIEKDGKVTPQEFIKYYGNVSSSIDEDDYFELVIRNAWHISGGKGWCANSSCRRVLVIHTDGKQTVEEIKNDIGIKADDKETILANLAAQGITDVASIDLKGSTASTSTPPPAAPVTTAAPAPTPANKSNAPPSPQRPAAGGRSNNTSFLTEQIRPGSAATSYNPRRAPGGQSSIIFG